MWNIFGCVAKREADLLKWREKSERGPIMSSQNQDPFKWRHFQSDLILLGSVAHNLVKSAKSEQYLRYSMVVLLTIGADLLTFHLKTCPVGTQITMLTQNLSRHGVQMPRKQKQ